MLKQSKIFQQIPANMEAETTEIPSKYKIKNNK